MAIAPMTGHAQGVPAGGLCGAVHAGLDELERLRPDVRALRWMIEELRVSLFAQQLGTPYPISDKRVLQAMEQITA